MALNHAPSPRVKWRWSCTLVKPMMAGGPDEVAKRQASLVGWWRRTYLKLEEKISKRVKFRTVEIELAGLSCGPQPRVLVIGDCGE